MYTDPMVTNVKMIDAMPIATEVVLVLRVTSRYFLKLYNNLTYLFS